MSGWGPDGRRAAVALCFERLAGELESVVVTPALPAVLQALGERDLPATFLVESDAVQQEPLALTMIANAGNEIGALAMPGAHPLRALDALAAAGRDVHGVGARRIDEALLAELSGYPSVRYVAAPGADIEMVGGVVRLPVDRGIAAAGGSQAWHAAMQLAVARAIERRAQVTLTFTPGLLERGDALGVFVETLDLVAGLRRAGRLWVPTLDGLASWWLERAQR